MGPSPVRPTVDAAITLRRAAAALDLLDDRQAVNYAEGEILGVLNILLQRDNIDPDVRKAGVDERFLNRINRGIAERYSQEGRRIGWEEPSHDFVRNPAKMIVAKRVPDVEQIPAARRQHAPRFARSNLVCRRRQGNARIDKKPAHGGDREAGGRNDEYCLPLPLLG